ncbi:hypothetical protein [Dasania marina]|uniref:hypothetical protein n=1 Tax=Dasania marina TaxID=471499 RepID=UPI0003673387|nr:hypothetical protein [Dasania marina]
MQKLEVFQSLWAMGLRHPDKDERSHEQNFAMVAEAGYHGMCLDPSLNTLAFYDETRELFDKYKLKSMFNLFPKKVNEMKPLLEFAKGFNPAKVNTIGQVMPIGVVGAIPVIYRWLQEADDMGINLLFETHRDGILNDLFYTLEVIDNIPELELTGDLSHFVVDREFSLPLSLRDQSLIRRILERTDCFQGRIACREQVQIQIDFPQHQEWVNVFKVWWQQGMRLWRQRNANDATCIFLCELGPPSYAITDAKGYELSDRWQEALTLRRWAQEIWAELDEEFALQGK